MSFREWLRDYAPFFALATFAMNVAGVIMRIIPRKIMTIYSYSALLPFKIHLDVAMTLAIFGIVFGILDLYFASSGHDETALKMGVTSVILDITALLIPFI